MNSYYEVIRLAEEVATGAFSLVCVVFFGGFAWFLLLKAKLPLLSPMMVCAITGLVGGVILLAGSFMGQCNMFDHPHDTLTENIGIMTMMVGVCIGWIYRPLESM